MEQMYLVEIFIDKVSIFLPEGEDGNASRKLTLKVKFGPKTQFIIKEGQLALNDDKKSEGMIECDEQNRRKFTRTIRVGKSMLFPSYPDTVLRILSKFPLELEVWDDDTKEGEIFVGIGTMEWDTAFFFMLKETAEACKRVEPLSIKQITPLMAECCCKQVGEVHFILRLSALGENIITEFQQLLKDPETFVFRTNRAPSMFQCKRIEDNDPNFCMVGSLYETTTLEDPSKNEDNEKPMVEICTELQSCGNTVDKEVKCEHKKESEDSKKKTYPIDKIRMGDITGPCGNTNCPLAHKVRMYIRNLETYKKEAAGKISKNKDENVTKNVCGTCVCKDDRWHREECTESKKDNKNMSLCKECGGHTKAGQTCEEMQNRTGSGPIKTTVAYVYNVNQLQDYKGAFNLVQSLHNKCVNPTFDEFGFVKSSCGEYSTHGVSEPIITKLQSNNVSSSVCNKLMPLKSGCCCASRKIETNYTKVLPTSKIMTIKEEKSNITQTLQNMSSNNNPYIYNLTVPMNDLKPKHSTVNSCTANPQNKDCRCDPPKPKPLCSTFNCECIPKCIEKSTRKHHKPYCPSYKHKANCPVSKINDEQDEEKKKDDDEDEQEPLPYGLPPIVLGPCPVMGRPCTVPDGFARMYKTAALAPQPPSYSDAGKVCCSKEFERIKKALKDYMRHEKEHDFRCVNRFNIDTERRCCDKEQILMAMMGKGCCGEHKLSIQEKFKEEKK